MTALLLTATLSAWTAAQARQAPPRIVSPEVGADRLSKFLTERRIVHTFHATDGAHTWMVWRKYLYEISPLLFK
jgi:enterochelin esterase-like enzyme